MTVIDFAAARIGAAYEAAAASGQAVNGLAIRGELQFAKEGLMVKDAAGKLAVVPGTEAAINQLNKLEDFVTKLGDDIPVDKAWAVKQMWDGIAAKAGLFGPKTMSTATDNAEAWAMREGASAFRNLLDEVPDVAGLNKEFKFWAGLRDVLKATEQRTQGHGPGLIASGTGGAGAVASAVSGGGVTGAVLTGWAAKTLAQLTQSAAWRTSVSAPMKLGRGARQRQQGQRDARDQSDGGGGAGDGADRSALITHAR